MSTAFTELSREQLGLGSAPCHACPSLCRMRVHPLPDSTGSRALWFSFTNSLSPAQLLSSPPHCEVERRDKSCLPFFFSSLQLWLTVVSVSSVVLQWFTRFWGAEVAAGQCIKDTISKSPSHCSPCAYQSRRQSSLFHSFSKAVYWREKQEREGRWNGKGREERWMARDKIWKGENGLAITLGLGAV